MEYMGDKLSVAQTQMSGWVGNVRRSLHGALGFLSNPMERGGRGEDGTGDFKRTNSLRSLASRSRESIRRFSLRSQQRLSLRRRTAPNTPTSVRHTFQVETHKGSSSSAFHLRCPSQIIMFVVSISSIRLMWVQVNLDLNIPTAIKARVGNVF